MKAQDDNISLPFNADSGSPALSTGKIFDESGPSLSKGGRDTGDDPLFDVGAEILRDLRDVFADMVTAIPKEASRILMER